MSDKLTGRNRPLPTVVRQLVRRGVESVRSGDNQGLAGLTDRLLRPSVRRGQAELVNAGDDAPALVRARTKRRITDLGYLFIVTYGRSGSTLLQGVLNSIPGYRIHGENRDALHDLFRYHHTLNTHRLAKTKPYPLPPESSWYGIDRYDHEEAIKRMRSLVVRTLLVPDADTRVVGFKEIRWWHADWQEYFDFLQLLFPGARFVVNTRSHDAVAQSKWWTESKNPRAELKRYEARLDEIAERLGDRAFRVHYDDYAGRPEALAGLFGWLGEPLDTTTIAEVMAKRHSY